MLERKKVFYLRRGIFLFTALAVALPLLWPKKLSMITSWPAQDLYNFIEALPRDKVIIVTANWTASTYGENGLQTSALLTHLAKAHRPFVIWSWGSPQGAELAQDIAEPIARRYHLKYGVDWVNWGFRVGSDTMLRGWANDVWAIIKNDYRGTPLDRLPLMARLHSYRDMGLIIDISSGSWSGMPTIDYYVQFLKGIHNVPLGYATTAIGIPEAFPYLDSGQIVGLLRGLAGAAEYEKLVGYSGEATQRMTPQSYGHFFIILLIVLGNIGYFLNRKKEAGNPPAPGS